MEARVGNPMEPIAVRTNLGWTVYGPRYSTTVATNNYLGVHQQTKNDDQHEHPQSCHMMKDTVVTITQETNVRKAPERTKKPTTGRFETELLGKSHFDKQIIGCKQNKQVNIGTAPAKQRQVEGTYTSHVSAQKARPRHGEFQSEEIRWKQAAVHRSGSWLDAKGRKWKRQTGSLPENMQQQSKGISQQNSLKLGESTLVINRKNRKSFNRGVVEVTIQSPQGRALNRHVSTTGDTGSKNNKFGVVKGQGKFGNTECYGLGCCDAVVSLRETLNRPSCEYRLSQHKATERSSSGR
nr:uncharacterized protein LOC115266136 [Aedes albopictus]